MKIYKDFGFEHNGCKFVLNIFKNILSIKGIETFRLIEVIDTRIVANVEFKTLKYS